MVQVRQTPDLDATGDIDLQRWVSGLPHAMSSQERARALDACQFSRDLLAHDGQDTPDWALQRNSFIAGLEIAQILADLHVDIECLIASILYRAVREQRVSLDAVELRFGNDVSGLISGVLRMAAIGQLPLESEAPVLGQATDQKDNIRKMLIAMVDDVRVALIKLAERTCAIRAVKDDESRRRKVAQEVFDVYAPLAHRLGIGQLKWELEDLSFRYIYADAYRKIAKLLDGKRLERDRFIAAVRDDLSRVLRDASLDVEIAGRSKHIYSIWRKMQRKGIGFSQVYDVRAVRILVPEIKDCYVTLGLVHGLWRNIPNEFDDYIANPKENGYRSLHTAVIGPDGKVLEVQIRTHQMHQEAELGVCAHWRYKGADGDSMMASTYEEKIAWLRHVLDWHDETGDAGATAEQFRFEVAQDRVYVFTPDGDVVNLAQGATPLDFAYHVHTEIGHRCRGAKVNGTIVPLTYQLAMGEQVEILTSKEAKPRRDWLTPSAGYLRTSRARAKVQLWFRGQAREDNIDAGRHLLEKELRALALTSMDYALIARKMHFGSVEYMYACVGAGDIGSAQVMQAARGLVGIAQESQPRLTNSPNVRHVGLVDVEGVGSLMSHIAGCCKPVLGDEVVGFVTQGRGVSVHRADCARLLGLRVKSESRVVDIQWEPAQSTNYEVDVVIQANDRQGLLRDITGLFANARINVLSIKTRTHKKSALATMRLRVEVPNLATLEKLFERILRLNNVLTAKRASD